MAEQTMAVLDERGVVTNLIVVEDGAQWVPPDGHQLERVDDASTTIGDRWDGASFWVPDAVEPAGDPQGDAVAALQEQIDALTQLVLEGPR